MVTNSNSIFWLSGLVFFAIVLQAKCKGQYQQWHYVLQHLHNKSWRLIVIGRWCLCWLAYTVVAGNLCWKSVGVNLPNKVFFHHLCCWITVANIFKISGGILLCVKTKTNILGSCLLFSLFLYWLIFCVYYFDCIMLMAWNWPR